MHVTFFCVYLPDCDYVVFFMCVEILLYCIIRDGLLLLAILHSHCMYNVQLK